MFALRDIYLAPLYSPENRLKVDTIIPLLARIVTRLDGVNNQRLGWFGQMQEDTIQEGTAMLDLLFNTNTGQLLFENERVILNPTDLETAPVNAEIFPPFAADMNSERNPEDVYRFVWIDLEPAVNRGEPTATAAAGPAEALGAALDALNLFQLGYTDRRRIPNLVIYMPAKSHESHP